MSAKLAASEQVKINATTNRAEPVDGENSKTESNGSGQTSQAASGLAREMPSEKSLAAKKEEQKEPVSLKDIAIKMIRAILPTIQDPESRANFAYDAPNRAEYAKDTVSVQQAINTSAINTSNMSIKLLEALNTIPQNLQQQLTSSFTDVNNANSGRLSVASVGSAPQQQQQVDTPVPMRS